MKRYGLFSLFITTSLLSSPINKIHKNFCAPQGLGITQKKPTQKLHERFNDLLASFLLQCKTMQTAEELSQALICLTFIKSFNLELFKKYQLEPLLKSCFDQAEKLPFPENPHLFELQPFFDFWYLAKLHNRKQYEFIKPEIINNSMNAKAIKKQTGSEAFVSWIYLNILKDCNPKKYKSLKKYEKHLIKEIKKDTEMASYALALSTFYETKFGTVQKKEPQVNDKFIGSNRLNTPLDINAHLFLHSKLINNFEATREKRALLLIDAEPHNFQELCFLTACAS